MSKPQGQMKSKCSNAKYVIKHNLNRYWILVAARSATAKSLMEQVGILDLRGIFFDLSSIKYPESSIVSLLPFEAKLL
jgi:hypothetical protein